MDIQVLDYIVTIADCGSISKAAQKLFITQSGLNQQLIKLENKLGVKLFERDNHHLEITPAGRLIVDSATEILRIRRNTLTQLSDLQTSISGLISLGLTMNTASMPLLPFISSSTSAIPTSIFPWWKRLWRTSITC